MRNREEISKKVKQTTARMLDITDSEVTDEASFSNDLGADSLDALELCMELERELDISIPDQDFEKISTVGQLIDYLVDGVLPE